MLPLIKYSVKETSMTKNKPVYLVNFFFAFLYLLLSVSLFSKTPDVKPLTSKTENLLSYYNHLFSADFIPSKNLALSDLHTANNLIEFDSALYRLLDTQIFPEQLDNLKMLLQNDIVNRFNSLLYKDIISFSKKENYIQKIDASGPFIFSNTNDFLKAKPDLSSVKSSARSIDLSPVKISSDQNGIFHVDNLYPIKERSYYQISFNYFSKKDEAAELIIGKTGPLKLFHNSKQITINTSHHFEQNQYRIPMNIQKGKNNIIILCSSNNRFENKISLRLETDNIRNLDHEWSYYYVPENKTSIDYINTAFLFYKKKLYGDYNAVSPLLSKVDSSAFDNVVSYIQLCLSDNYSEKIYHINKLNAKLDKNYINYLETLCYVELSDTERALQRLNLLEKNIPSSPLEIIAKIRFYTLMNWHFKLEKLIDQLTTFSPLLAKHIAAEIYYNNKEYTKSEKIYSDLFMIDQNNIKIMDRYLDSLKLSYSGSLYTANLYRMLYFFPENFEIKLLLADNLYRQGKYSDSLVVLSSCSSIAKNHPQYHYLQSKNYLLLNKKDLARYHSTKATLLSPGNNPIQDYHNYNFNSSEYLSEHIQNFDTNKLVNKGSKLNEAVVVLYNETIEKYESDGTSLKRVRTQYLINNSANNISLNSISFSLNSSSDSLKAFNCNLSTDKGSINLKNLSRRSLSDPESRLYYDIDLYSLTLPQMPDKSILSVDYTLKINSGKDYAGYIGNRYYLSERYPVLKRRILVITPETVPLYWSKNKAVGNIEVSKKNNSFLYLYQYSNANSSIYETNQLPFFNQTPSITATSFKNWNDLFNWYGPLVIERETFTSEMQKDFNSLITKDMSDEEKIRAIYSHITKRTRYLGFEIGIGGIQPRHTHITYQSRLGDCKDIALLLSVFYKKAGFDARMALIRTTSGGFPDIDVPYIGNFNHAICYLNYNGGLFLDGTVNHADIYDLPEGDRNTVTAVINNTGVNFINTSSNIYSDNRDTIRSEIKLYDNGSAEINRFLEKDGTSALYFRNRYKSDPIQLENLSVYWNKIYPESLVSNYVSENRTGTGPVRYGYKIIIPDYFNNQSDYVEIPLDPVPYSYFKNHAQQIIRETPMFLGSSEKIITTTIYSIPENYSIVKAPKSFSDKFLNISYSLNYNQISKNRIEIITKLEIDKAVIETANYNEFRKFIIEIEKINKQSMFIKKD